MKKNNLIPIAIAVCILGIFSLSISGFIILNKRIKEISTKKDLNIANSTVAQFDYSQLIESLMSSVVNIEVTSLEEVINPLAEVFKSMPFKDSGMSDLFKNQKKNKKKMKHFASGFFYSKNGYIITNAHVIENAVEVKIIDYKKNEYSAKVVGMDKSTDIGVLKLQEKSSLVPASLGNSSEIKIGQGVITIGNPFSLENTVTVGIISAKDRKLDNPFVDYIQTDSAINQGNSGGPMFNLKGEVIGINTLIITSNGGNVGLGFAVPSNLVIDIADKIISKGEIVRAKAGLLCRNLDENIQKALSIKEGAIILGMDKKANIYSSGIKEGDVVTGLNAKPITDCKDLAFSVSQRKPEELVNFEIYRFGKKLNFNVKLQKRDDLQDQTSQEPQENTKMIKGILVAQIENKDETCLCKKEGVIVKDIENEYVLELDNLMIGDIIYKINETEVHDLKSFQEAMSNVKKYGIFFIKRHDAKIINGIQIEK